MLIPQPRQCDIGESRLRLGGDLGALAVPGGLLLPGSPVAARVSSDAPFGAELPEDQRAEAYSIDVDQEGARVTAATAEGLLRAQATLMQLLGPDGTLPYCRILDWPLFRLRCASDWLLNCEINRWGYDWGDGPEATLARLKRKLDLCFAHKINQVWFDGFGWSLDRTPWYARLVRECNRYARERGIRLTFAGYGGGYGTSYQTSELYRCGYQGQVFLNRRPWPDGQVYDCTGCDVPESRKYGTCPSNEGLKAAKLAELTAFVSAVEPGCLYIHDVDTGSFEASRQSWLWRCDECRQRWPSDAMADPQGHAGAYAAWFGQVEAALHGVRNGDGYDAGRDLTISFVSPVYTVYSEKGQPELWEQEVEYFRVLSQALGPREGVLFGVREQFYRAGGGPKVEHLRKTLDAVGNGHGVQVIAFGGGDNYLSNDLCNLSGTVAPVYSGARSVCFSNGGVHEEPLQLLNAELMWNGHLDGFSVDPGDETKVRELYERMAYGHWRPEEVFGEGRGLHRACRHLWGEQAANLMYRAYLCGGESGDGPVSRVWWVVTREVRRLMGDGVMGPAWTWGSVAQTWARRVAHTAEALGYARAATEASDDEDIAWFARALEVGLGFSQVVREAALWKATGDEAHQGAAAGELKAVQELVASRFALSRTDLLGGDPGCWMETAGALRKVLEEGGLAAPGPG